MTAEAYRLVRPRNSSLGRIPQFARVSGFQHFNFQGLPSDDVGEGPFHPAELADAEPKEE